MILLYLRRPRRLARCSSKNTWPCIWARRRKRPGRRRCTGRPARVSYGGRPARASWTARRCTPASCRTDTAVAILPVRSTPFPGRSRAFAVVVATRSYNIISALHDGLTLFSRLSAVVSNPTRISLMSSNNVVILLLLLSLCQRPGLATRRQLYRTGGWQLLSYGGPVVTTAVSETHGWKIITFRSFTHKRTRAHATMV